MGNTFTAGLNAASIEASEKAAKFQVRRAQKIRIRQWACRDKPALILRFFRK